jgi:hypothetical protein
MAKTGAKDKDKHIAAVDFVPPPHCTKCHCPAWTGLKEGLCVVCYPKRDSQHKSGAATDGCP